MPLMRLVVCFDGRISARSQFHLHPLRALTRPPRFAFHLLCLHNLFLLLQWPTCCSYFVSFHSLPRSVDSLRSRAYRFSVSASSSCFSPFLPLALHWHTNSRPKYLLFTSFTLKRSGFPVYLLLRNSLTRSLHRMPNSHDLLPTSPPVFTYNRHSTGI